MAHEMNDGNQLMEIDDDEQQPINTEDDCQCGSQQCQDLRLSHELDTILDISRVILSPSQLDKIWSLLAFGQPNVQTFLGKLNEYRIERHCGFGWPPGYVAYRCRTCATSPMMAICPDCFKAGNHEGHDYNMFKSPGGGACDCGYNFMKPEGVCRRHGENAKAPRSEEPIPESLVCIARRAMPRIIHRLALLLRRESVASTGEVDIYLDFLINIADSSAVLRHLMIETLISESIYSSQIELLNHHTDETISEIAYTSLKILRREKKKFDSFKIPPEWKAPPRTTNAFCDNNTIRCFPSRSFLEEFVFWIIAFECHQKLVCFATAFLMDPQYKRLFGKTFVRYYPRFTMYIINQHRRHPRPQNYQLSSRLLQITVQLYQDSNLTKELCERESALHIIIYSLRFALEGSKDQDVPSLLLTNPLGANNCDAPEVVSLAGDNSLLRFRKMSSFTEDLLAILQFDHGAMRLVEDTSLLNIWMDFLSYFQTMSPYKRELNEHTPFESGHSSPVFAIELEFCSSPMWNILRHFGDESRIDLTAKLLQTSYIKLARWFYNMHLISISKLRDYFMSFHIPLHRIFAATVRHIMYNQNKSAEFILNLLEEREQMEGPEEKLWPPGLVKNLMVAILHPLQALTLYHQTRSNMWIRNGLMAISQGVSYVNCNFSYSTIDLDMFLLRFCATKIKTEMFMRSLLQNFHAWNFLSFTSGPVFTETSREMQATRVFVYYNLPSEQLTQMVEACLTTLIQLITLDLHCDISPDDQAKEEIISMISVADRCYSYLVNVLPNRILSDKNKMDDHFTGLLKQLTNYKPAQHGSNGNFQPGRYTLKEEIWDEKYNPMHVMYRYYQRRDYQMSLDRFFHHAKRAGKLQRRYHSSTLWPPLLIPNRAEGKTKLGCFGPLDLGVLVQSPSILGLVFAIIYKSLYIEEVPDSIMAYAIHLLELSLRRSLQDRLSQSDSQDDDDVMEQDDLKKEPTGLEKNAEFTGRYCYRELITFVHYYTNQPRENQVLRGRTIYSLFKEEAASDHELSGGLENPKIFPVVRHALDLAFETTWFPFASPVDNCLVHVETVHTMVPFVFEAFLTAKVGPSSSSSSSSPDPFRSPPMDFEAVAPPGGFEWLPREQQHNEQHVELATSNSTRSTESQTAWVELSDVELDGLLQNDDRHHHHHQQQQQQMDEQDDDLDGRPQYPLDGENLDEDDDDNDDNDDGDSDDDGDDDDDDDHNLRHLTPEERRDFDALMHQFKELNERRRIEEERTTLTGRGPLTSSTSGHTETRNEQMAITSGGSSNNNNDNNNNISDGNNDNNVSRLDDDNNNTRRQWASSSSSVRNERIAGPDSSRGTRQMPDRQHQVASPPWVHIIQPEDLLFGMPNDNNNQTHHNTMGSSANRAQQQIQTQPEDLVTRPTPAAILQPEPLQMITGPTRPLALEGSSSSTRSGRNNNNNNDQVEGTRASLREMDEESTQLVRRMYMLADPDYRRARRGRPQSHQQPSLPTTSSVSDNDDDDDLLEEVDMAQLARVLQTGLYNRVLMLTDPLYRAMMLQQARLANARRLPRRRQTPGRAIPGAFSSSEDSGTSNPSARLQEGQQRVQLAEADIQTRFRGFFQAPVRSRQNDSHDNNEHHYDQWEMLLDANVAPRPANARTEERVVQVNPTTTTTTTTTNANLTSVVPISNIMQAIADTRRRTSNQSTSSTTAEISDGQLDQMVADLRQIATSNPTGWLRRSSPYARGASREQPELPPRPEPAARRSVNAQSLVARFLSGRWVYSRSRGAAGTDNGPRSAPGDGATPSGSRRGTELDQQQQQQQQRLPLRKEYRQHHGESVLTLLLRLHAKYSHRVRSYNYVESRAKESLDLSRRGRIGDGAHFVTIALDLICSSDPKMMSARVEHLQELIWPTTAATTTTSTAAATTTTMVEGDKTGPKVDVELDSAQKRRVIESAGDGRRAETCDDIEIDNKTNSVVSGGGGAISNLRPVPNTPSGGGQMEVNYQEPDKQQQQQPAGGGGGGGSSAAAANPASLAQNERRRLAQERQTRLMAEFANKQRAFMENYVANNSGGGDASAPGRGRLRQQQSHVRGNSSSTSLAHQTASGSDGTHRRPATSQPMDSPRASSSSSSADKIQVAAGGNHGGLDDEEPINLSSKFSDHLGQQQRQQQQQQTSTAEAEETKPQMSDCDKSESPLLAPRPANTGHAGEPQAPPRRQLTLSEHDDKSLSVRGPGSGVAIPAGSSSGLGASSSSSSLSGPANKADDKPRRLIEKPADSDDGRAEYECCICGPDELADLTSPLGQIVLLQSTNLFGHSHLRPQWERQLPCTEPQQQRLREETYAKYLERRIDLLCEHFTESSWLDSINIGAEGGVHVQSCGHYLHIECHQSYIRSLDQEDRLRARNDTDEFLCPVCRQLANSVLPIAGRGRRSADVTKLREQVALPRSLEGCKEEVDVVLAAGGGASTAAAAAERLESTSKSNSAPSSSKPAIEFNNHARQHLGQLDDEIGHIEWQLQCRQAPDPDELRSSASFCAHLTKATGPQYRLVRSTANMHSLFLFLTSIARTNLETGLIVASYRQQARRQQCQRQPTTTTTATSTSVNPSREQTTTTDLACNTSGPEQQTGDTIRQAKELIDGDCDVARCGHPNGAAAAAAPQGNQSRKSSCFQPLFQVLALNAQTLINDQWFSCDQVWSHLTHRVDEKNRLSVKPTNNVVPLLLRDPVAMLLQFLFALANRPLKRRANFTCLVRIIFNLAVIQSMALVLSYNTNNTADLGGHCRACNKTASEKKKNRPGRCGGRSNLNATAPSRDKSQASLAQGDQAEVEVEVELDGDQQATGSQVQDNTNLSQRLREQRPELARHENDFDHQGMDNVASDRDVCPSGDFGQLVSMVRASLGQLLAPSSDQPLMNSYLRDSWPRLVVDSLASEPPGEHSANVSYPDEDDDDDDEMTGDAGMDSCTCNDESNTTYSDKQLDFIANKVKLACLSYLRAAAYLQQELYNHQLPELLLASDERELTNSAAIDADFDALVGCLGLAAGAGRSDHAHRPHQVSAGAGQASGATSGYKSLNEALNWPTAAGVNGRHLIVSWSNELSRFGRDFPIAARTLLVCRPLAWYRPGLMQLPHAFYDIFMFYYGKKCILCQQVPKDIAVCLVCGAPICFRVSCCKDRIRSTQVHSQQCTANTALFLAVNTSSIVVVRRNRVSLWGSVYLDAHEEEDTNFQRGRPLYLVPARFALLESQWLTHSFDHTRSRWVFL